MSRWPKRSGWRATRVVRPYLSERQWGTVREDYSADGKAWSHFPHEHAPSRVYRWGEDGLLGICDRQCRLCFALALHNGEDPILKALRGRTAPRGRPWRRASRFNDDFRSHWGGDTWLHPHANDNFRSTPPGMRPFDTACASRGEALEMGRLP